MPRFAALATIVAALAAALVVLLAGGGEPGAQAQEQVKPPGKIPPDPFRAGLPFEEPPVVRSRDGRLRTTLRAENATVEISGKDVGETQTYAARGPGGSPARGFLGPTLRVRPGDVVQITLDNQLTVPEGAIGAACLKPGGDHLHGQDEPAQAGEDQLTNLHFHGLHVTPREREPFGDSVLVDLPNGKSRIRFTIPHRHDEGTFWYHAHRHECTDDQVFRGLAGLLIVGDSRNALPRRFRGLRTRSLALKDVQVETAASGSGLQIADDHDWGNSTHRTVNGRINPVMDIRPGETQLWRLANVSSAVWYNVALVDPAGGTRDPFTIVAQDGNSLRHAVRQRALVIPPGRRFDVLVRAPASGQRILRTLEYFQGRLTFPEDDLATMAVGRGEPMPAIEAPAKLRPPVQRFPARRGPTRRFTFDIDSRTKPTAFTINDAVFDADIPDASTRLGTTERWVIYNKSGEEHPFHIHQDDFRVVEASGGPPRLPGDQDIVVLPRGTPDKPSRVVIDMPFTDYAGNFVFHCHILDHEDAGMMSRVQVKRRNR